MYAEEIVISNDHYQVEIHEKLFKFPMVFGEI